MSVRLGWLWDSTIHACRCLYCDLHCCHERHSVRAVHARQVFGGRARAPGAGIDAVARGVCWRFRRGHCWSAILATQDEERAVPNDAVFRSSDPSRLFSGLAVSAIGRACSDCRAVPTAAPEGGHISHFNIEVIWSGRRGSNPRPRPWQGRALPLSYTRIRKRWRR